MMTAPAGPPALGAMRNRSSPRGGCRSQVRDSMWAGAPRRIGYTVPWRKSRAGGQDVARILLIDDDADLSHFLRCALEEHGHQVECLERAEHGPEVLARAPFDLVLLDNKMPGMSGIGFLEALQERGIDVPVILMTGYSTYDTAIRAMNLGAFDYVIKPDDLQSL